MTKLVDEIKKYNLSWKDRLLLSMFPGMAFGFVPLHLREIRERLNCPTCIRICEVTKLYEDTERNAIALQSWWRRLRVFRRFVRYTYVEVGLLLSMKKEINQLIQEDSQHWESKDAREISEECRYAYLARENWEHISAGAD